MTSPSASVRPALLMLPLALAAVAGSAHAQCGALQFDGVDDLATVLDVNNDFDFGSEIDHYLGPYRYAEFQATELDAYVLVGPALADVVRRVQDLTGTAPLPPRWSLTKLANCLRLSYTLLPVATYEPQRVTTAGAM